MIDYLKKYEVELKTIGPVFIGSGREINKKEYIFWNRNKVGVMDVQKLYVHLHKTRKSSEYEKFILENNGDLFNWLRKQNIQIKDVESCIKYSLDCGDKLSETGKGLQVLECVKDAYGKPYIPGSSLKGMLRTILLCEELVNQPEKYKNQKESVIQEVFAKSGRTNRTIFLSKEATQIESDRYRTLKRNEKKSGDAVNDILQGLVVSDSEPLSIENLVFCQKVDLHPDGKEKGMPILRECIKPGTTIRFTITIDTSVCAIDDLYIMSAIKTFLVIYHNCFLKKFPGLEPLRVNQCFLGGGSGFVSKTIVYSMFGSKEGLNVTKNIFMKTGVPKVHKHEKDNVYGASPHILKCTRYNGKLLQMGLCSLKIL